MASVWQIIDFRKEMTMGSLGAMFMSLLSLLFTLKLYALEGSSMGQVRLNKLGFCLAVFVRG